MTNIRGTAMNDTYNFGQFLKDLTAMTAIGATMMLMLYCLLQVQP